MRKAISSFFMIGMIFLVPFQAYAGSAQQLVKKGNTAYLTGKYDEALEAYEAASVEAPESPHIYFNKGTAFYQKQDYANAAEAFKQAAIKSKDIKLETYSKFNLGVCAFREAERQKDSDLNKAMEACSQSIRYFQEALELTPDFKEAAENIEVVRLTMKSILDEIKKNKEQQDVEQHTAQQIKDIIKKQQQLIDRNQVLGDEMRHNGQSKELHEKAQDLAQGQKDLQNETRMLAQQMTPSDQDVPKTFQQIKAHMDKSIGHQGAAVEKLEQDQVDPAGTHQENALKDLEKALDSLGNATHPQNQKSDKKQGQQTQPSVDKQSAHSKDDKKENTPMIQLPDDARSILDEEKENKKRRHMYSNGGYQRVDKDW